jgi:hypothetical protein
MRVLKPFSDAIGFTSDRDKVKALHKQLCDIVVPRYTRHILERFREQDFIVYIYSRQEGSYDMKCLLLNATGPLWGGLRKEALSLLASAKDDLIVHQNAYELLTWFDDMLRKGLNLDEGQSIQRWLKDDQLRCALWGAVTSHPLNPRAVGSLKEFFDRLAGIGVAVQLPDWWKPTLEALGNKRPKASGGEM